MMGRLLSHSVYKNTVRLIFFDVRLTNHRRADDSFTSTSDFARVNKLFKRQCSRRCVESQSKDRISGEPPVIVKDGTPPGGAKLGKGLIRLVYVKSIF